MRKINFRSICIAVAGVTTLVATSMVTAAPLGAAAPATVLLDCTGESAHQAQRVQSNNIRSNQPVRSGLYEECTVRFNGPAAASLECYHVNARGNVWWFANTNKGQGWVYEPNLSSPPNRTNARCEGTVQPAP